MGTTHLHYPGCSLELHLADLPHWPDYKVWPWFTLDQREHQEQAWLEADSLKMEEEWPPHPCPAEKRCWPQLPEER